MDTIYEFGLDDHSLSTKTGGWVRSIDYFKTEENFAKEWIKEHFAEIPTAGCTSIAKGDIHGRNYDWYYDNHPTIKVSVKNAFIKFTGFAPAIGELTKSFIESHATSDVYRVLPFMLADGMNEEGFCASMNVCQIYDDAGNIDITNQGDGICGLMLVSKLLNECKTIGDARTYIENHQVWMPNSEALREELHLLVSDKNGSSYIIEWKDGEAVFNPIFEERDIITNYKQAAKTGSDYGMGYERFQIVKDILDADGTIEEALEAVKYTKVYESFETDSPWNSECNGKTGEWDLHEGLPDSAYEGIRAAMINLYNSRSRDTGKTWQTVHTAIYDKKNLTIKLFAQEMFDQPIEMDGFNTAEYLPLFDPNSQFRNVDEKLLVGGKLFVYDGETNNLSEVFDNESATVRLPQPIVLDNLGRAEVYVEGDKIYRLEVYDYKMRLLWTRTGRPMFFISNYINHDETLIGGGSIDNPLGVNTEVINTVERHLQEVNERIAADAYLQFQIDNIHSEVIHDDTLSGNGTSAQPLGVVSAGVTEVKHDDTLSGKGTDESPLGVNNIISLATESPITNRTEGNQLIIGIDTTAIMPSVSHDGTLSGNGTSANPLGVIGDITPYSAGNNISITNHVISSENQTFIAEIGTTTFAEIENALSEGKNVIGRKTLSDGYKYYTLFNNDSRYCRFLNDMLGYGGISGELGGGVVIEGYILFKEGNAWVRDNNSCTLDGRNVIEANLAKKFDTSAFSTVSGTFLTAHQSLDGYATEQWVEDKGYLTAHQDISNKLDTTAFSTVSGEFASANDMQKAFARIEANSANISALDTWKTNVTPIVAGVISGVTNNNNTLTFTKVDGSTTAVTITGGEGHTYNGISGINVDNTNDTVGLDSATTAILSSVSSQLDLVAGDNITFTETENGLVIAAQGGALPQSANWNNCYTTVNSNSANWQNTRTTVNSNSGTWNNKQDKLTFSYANNAITAINASAIGGTIEGYSAVAGNHFSIVDDDTAKTTTMGIDFTLNIEDL